MEESASDLAVLPVLVIWQNCQYECASDLAELPAVPVIWQNCLLFVEECASDLAEFSVQLLYANWTPMCKASGGVQFLESPIYSTDCTISNS